MPSAPVPMRRTVPRSWSRSFARLWVAVAAISLASCGGALAQTFSNAKAQTAYSEWRALPQAEVNCVDRALQAQRSNLWTWIQRGVSPTDPSVAKLRAGCGARIATPNTQGMTALAQSDAAKKAAEKAAADKAAAEKASAEKAAAAKAAAEKAAFEKAATEKFAAEKAAAEKLAADKAAAEKVAAEKAAAEKAAADKLAAEKAAAAKAAAEKAAAEAAEKIAAEVAAAEKMAAEKAAAEAAALAEKEAAEKAADEKLAALKAAEEEKAAAEKAVEVAAAEKAAAEKAAADAAALAEAERVKLETIRAKTEAEVQKQDAISAALSQTASESRISFLYGLVLGMVFASLAAAVFLLMQRKKMSATVQAKTEEAMEANRERQSEFDRMVTAMLTEHERRFSKKPSANAAPAPAPAAHEQRVDWSALH